MNPRCVILSGPSGAGKSTVAKNLTASLPRVCYAILSADDFFTKRGNGVYDFDPKLLPEAHKACYLDFVSAINIRVPLVIVDNTNISGWEIAPYYRYAEVMGYDVSITKLIVRPEVCAARNVHGVPAKAVESMAKRHGGGWCPHWKVTEQTN
jgi:predicted ABC-type ATPase